MQVTSRVHLLSTRIIALFNTWKPKENSERGILFFFQQYIGTYAIDVWENISSGGRLNKKDGLTRYGNSYVKDKTS